MPLEKQGTCLCGAITLRIPVDETQVSACHCNMCRKWTGGPLLCVHSDHAPTFEGREPNVYDSSEWAQRAFCGQCGTHLYYRLTGKTSYAIPVGLFDGDQAWDFNLEIFIEQKPTWYCFANQTRALTGEQAFDELG